MFYIATKVVTVRCNHSAQEITAKVLKMSLSVLKKAALLMGDLEHTGKGKILKRLFYLGSNLLTANVFGVLLVVSCSLKKVGNFSINPRAYQSVCHNLFSMFFYNCTI